MYAVARESALGMPEVVGLALLGVLLAETVEALRLFVNGSPRGRAYQWPRALPLSRYVVGSTLRVTLAVLVAMSLSALGIACNGALAFLSGLSTLKVIEVVVGYTGRGS